MTRAVQQPLWGSALPVEIDPDAITVRRVTTDVIVRLQNHMSRAVWRPAPGRKMGFLVEHSGDLIGICFLSSQVINLAARDKYLGLSKDPIEKGHQLREYAEMSVCVGMQPIAWYWNIGKLIAMLATTLGDVWSAHYGDVMRGVTTTSLWGRSSQYNRIYRFLGYTKGFGHEHINDDRYAEMMGYLVQNNIRPPRSRFGDGSNSRMRRIQAYAKASGVPVSMQHGNIRGVYFAPAVDPALRSAVIREWYGRWGYPRWQRTRNQKPPYVDGTQAEAASSDAPGGQSGEGGSQPTLPLHSTGEAAKAVADINHSTEAA